MPIRRFTSREYTPGLYGPFTLTGVARANANTVRLTVTQQAAWPDVPAALRLSCGFSNGWAGGATLPGGWMTARDGTTGTGIFMMGSDTMPEFDSCFFEFEAYTDIEVAFTLESVVRVMREQTRAQKA
jgi:hypothetical protein